MFQEHFKLSFVLQFCSCMDLYAATRVEGGLVMVGATAYPGSGTAYVCSTTTYLGCAASYPGAVMVYLGSVTAYLSVLLLIWL